MSKPTKPTPKLAIYIDAGNDREANPRRGWLVVDASGDAIVFVNEGYGGHRELAFVLGQEVPASGSVPTTPAFYRDMLRDYAPGAAHCRWS